MAQAAPWRDPWEATIPPPPPEDRDEPPPKERERREGEYLVPPVDWAAMWDWLRGRDVQRQEVPGAPYMGWGAPPGVPGREMAWRARGAPPPTGGAPFPEGRYPTPGPWPTGGFQPAYPQWAEGFEMPELQAWMEQVQAWERGEIPALPAKPEGLALPREWETWYGQVTTPELRPEGNVEYYAREFAESPAVSLPEDYHRKTDEEQISWLSAHAYETVYTDEQGNIIDVSEVMRRALVNPEEAITQVFIMGGGETKAVEFSAGDIQTMEELRPPRPRVAGAEVIGGEWVRGESTAAERARAQGVLDSSLIQSVLQSEWGYDEKMETIINLYSQLTGRALSLPARQALDAAIYESLTPEEQTALGQRVAPEPEAPEAEEPVDEAALSKDLAQYGVNLTANYPFISPITQQHLMRIPRETIDLMSRYLEGKGISFQDFLSVSAGWYGGGGQARTRWEVPRQWG